MVDLISLGGLLLAFFLVIMNGVFVAAEFAFVKVRPTQVNALVERGKPGAALVQDVIRNLDDFLAVSQLGITLSSLGLGPCDAIIAYLRLSSMLTPDVFTPALFLINR